MTNRNPYEKGVDIPDFVEKNDDVDLSQFKMPDIDLDDEDDEYEDEYESRKLSSKGITIILSIICAVLAIVAIAGWIFGISKNNSLNELKAEYETVQTKLTKANEDVTNLTTINTQLAAELEKAKESNSSSGESGTPLKSVGTYKVTVNGLGIRTGTSSKYDFVSKDILTDVVENECDINDSEIRLRKGAEFEVYEIKKADNSMSGKSSTWGRVIAGKEAWVCLVDEAGDAYATKK